LSVTQKISTAVTKAVSVPKVKFRAKKMKTDRNRQKFDASATSAFKILTNLLDYRYG